MVERIGAIAAEMRRYGYRRVHVPLRREGWTVNRKRKRIGPCERKPLAKPTEINVSWSMDLVADGLIDGRKLRRLVIVDDCSRECPVIEVDTSISGRRVVAVLQRLADLRGIPDSITVDHGPEFEGQVLDAWAYQNGFVLSFIRSGKPVENAYIESFNGRFHDECQNEHGFLTLAQARKGRADR